jgi:hypothetical protein
LMVFLQNNEKLVCSDLFFLQKLAWTKSATLWIGHGAVHRGPVEAIAYDLVGVWLAGPHHEEHGSKGGAKNSFLRSFRSGRHWEWEGGSSIERKMMTRALGSKGKEERWVSGGVVEASERGGGGSGPLYRSREWGAQASAAVVMVNEMTPLMS